MGFIDPGLELNQPLLAAFLLTQPAGNEKHTFRQVMVEETGFSYDILLIVVEALTGEVLHEEQITDFQPKNERKLEDYTDMFTDLYQLQNRLVGIFVPRAVQVKRALYSN